MRIVEHVFQRLAKVTERVCLGGGFNSLLMVFHPHFEVNKQLLPLFGSFVPVESGGVTRSRSLILRRQLLNSKLQENPGTSRSFTCHRGNFSFTNHNLTWFIRHTWEELVHESHQQCSGRSGNRLLPSLFMLVAGLILTWLTSDAKWFAALPYHGQRGPCIL